MNTILDLEALEIEEGSPRSQGSETPSSRASTSDSESQGSFAGAPNTNNQWRGFFKLLKKGSQMPFQPFHPLKNVPKHNYEEKKSNCSFISSELPNETEVLDSSLYKTKGISICKS